MKGYLATYIKNRKSQKHLESEPTKPTKPSFVGFVGPEVKRSFKIPYVQMGVQGICVVCGSDLKTEETDAVTIRFCPVGCSYIDYSLKPESNALLEKMLEAATVEEIDAMLDALNEREAVLIYNAMDEDAAKIFAENDLLPLWLDQFELNEKYFGKSVFGNPHE
ncbi:MAG TPA: hypothetical protein VF571_20385 [Pyrinomonadaceae bacterium]